MSGKRRRFSAEFKVKVAIEAIKGHKTMAQLAGEYQVYPNQIVAWKRQLLEAAPKVLGDKRDSDQREAQELTDRLYQRIGRLSEEVEYLKKKLWSQ